MNKTEQDARNRLYVRAGSLADATETYLVALKAGLLTWIASIDAELAIRERDRQARLRADQE